MGTHSSDRTCVSVTLCVAMTQTWLVSQRYTSSKPALHALPPASAVLADTPTPSTTPTACRQSSARPSTAPHVSTNLRMHAGAMHSASAQVSPALLSAAPHVYYQLLVEFEVVVIQHSERRQRCLCWRGHSPRSCLQTRTRCAHYRHLLTPLSPAFGLESSKLVLAQTSWRESLMCQQRMANRCRSPMAGFTLLRWARNRLPEQQCCLA